jgi:hypothetical protein
MIRVVLVRTFRAIVVLVNHVDQVQFFEKSMGSQNRPGSQQQQRAERSD